ncbi:hypothetical protein PCC6912_02690 [Chlorogloeopsis fritschii PCC 6912]|uniref:Uncharacterized protein n=1 Tax=Chlorogloeopsis fritschii PCC 6912 TaxID=211165 RepID=A0A3S5K2J6_CHLFR|nr:hypothetical protein [Chlorogloeopsis fritschii C42_A2020_084]RUR86826.1 hypothetical protein PCC6912_02690 [Chlorogloeopsis fritschii PCC 6912]
MNKHKLPLTVGIILLVLGFIVGVAPMKANAGKAVIGGTSEDSSSFSGTNFQFPGTNALVEVNNQILVPAVIQQLINQQAGAIVKNANTGNANGSQKGVMGLLLACSFDGSDAINQLQISLSNSGASQIPTQTLVKALTGLFKYSAPSLKQKPSLSSVEAQPREEINYCHSDENYDQMSVDVTQLLAAINAYNNIVLKSDLATLKKLSKNSDFIEIGKVLKELRTILI